MTDSVASEPTPYLQIEDYLPDDLHDRLVRAASDAVARHGPDAPIPPPVDREVVDADHTGFDIDLDELWRETAPLLRPALASARRVLGVDHFAIDGVVAQLTVHRPDGSFRSRPVGDDSTATRRVEFTYHFTPDPDAFTGGATHVYDTELRDDFRRATDDFAAIEPLDNSLVMLASDSHHDTTRIDAVGGHRDAIRFTLSGWFTGEPVERRRPEIAIDVQLALQVQLIPRHAEAAFLVRPTPAPVQQLLSALLQLRWHERSAEAGDRNYQDGGDPDFVDVGDLTAEIMDHLQPIHERFAGIQLEPSQIYGIRVYRRGQSLRMHVDRPGTHIVSSILQVAQRVDRPWPLQLEVDGRRQEVVLNPGQMLLYEGASCPHGRVTSLDGDFFANVFVHYRPIGWPWDPDRIIDHGLRRGLIDRDGRPPPL